MAKKPWRPEDLDPRTGLPIQGRVTVRGNLVKTHTFTRGDVDTTMLMITEHRLLDQELNEIPDCSDPLATAARRITHAHQKSLKAGLAWGAKISQETSIWMIDQNSPIRIDGIGFAQQHIDEARLNKVARTAPQTLLLARLQPVNKFRTLTMHVNSVFIAVDPRTLR